MPDLKSEMAALAAAVNETLEALIPSVPGPRGRVVEAMRYASLDGGKRVRPFLAVNTARLFDVADDHALRAAAAVEMVHCYSLVHDDLPAMDDDELRRGRPTCHREYDEATAILAGDALLTLSFEVLADEATHPDAGVRAELVTALARAAGAAGMVGGQMIDLQAQGLALDLDGVTQLQQLKTGALIGVACAAGAILGQAGAEERRALDAYAADLGLAFQIADDLLDVEGDADIVGKATGKDEGAGKATFVSLMGVEGARAEADRIVERAEAHLQPFGDKAVLLGRLARFVIERKA